VRAVRRELAARGGGYGSLKAVADELDLVRSAVHRLLKQHPA
jgi:DNA-binding IclR family transcriptional regulator